MKVEYTIAFEGDSVTVTQTVEPTPSDGGGVGPGPNPDDGGQGKGRSHAVAVIFGPVVVTNMRAEASELPKPKVISDEAVDALIEESVARRAEPGATP